MKKDKQKSKKMPALVIIEGPDLAGKSTLVNMFNDDRYIKHHFGAESELKTSQEYFKMMYKSLVDLWGRAVACKKDVIIDRSWISDAAYKHIRKDGGRVAAGNNLQYNGLCLGLFRKIATVLIVPHFSVIKERYNKRGDDYVTLEQLEIAYKYYDKMCNDINLNLKDCIEYGIPINNNSTAVFISKAVNKSNIDYQHIYDVEKFIKS